MLLGRVVFVALNSQLYCYICIHSGSTLPAQSGSAPLPAEHPYVDTVWLSARRAALTKSSVAVSLSSRDNGIFKICGLGREFTWFLNRMAGLRCDMVSSERHFKTELFLS